MERWATLPEIAQWMTSNVIIVMKWDIIKVIAYSEVNKLKLLKRQYKCLGKDRLDLHVQDVDRQLSKEDSHKFLPRHMCVLSRNKMHNALLDSFFEVLFQYTVFLHVY